MDNEPTKVTVTLGYTLNSRRAGENIDEAFDRVYSFVEAKLITKTNEAKEEVA
jgi:hypothetical protein